MKSQLPFASLQRLPGHLEGAGDVQGCVISKGLRTSLQSRLYPRAGHTTHGSSFFVVAAGVCACRSRRSVRQARVRMAATDAAGNKGIEEYRALVDEGRMITIEESTLRYASCVVVAAVFAWQYLSMQAVGSFNYFIINGCFTSFILQFESARQSL